MQESVREHLPGLEKDTRPRGIQCHVFDDEKADRSDVHKHQIPEQIENHIDRQEEPQCARLTRVPEFERVRLHGISNIRASAALGPQQGQAVSKSAISTTLNSEVGDNTVTNSYAVAASKVTCLASTESTGIQTTYPRGGQSELPRLKIHLHRQKAQ